MNRQQAIDRVGLQAVEAVEKENCEPTGRLQEDWDTTIEYKADIYCVSINGVDVVLSAMYYPDEQEFYAKYYFPNADDGELLGDLSYIDWEIDHYRIDGVA